MAISFSGNYVASGVNPGATAYTLTGTVAAKDVLVLYITGTSNYTGSVSLTDSLGSTWAALAQHWDGSANYLGIFFAQAPVGGTNPTINITQPGYGYPVIAQYTGFVGTATYDSTLGAQYFSSGTAVASLNASGMGSTTYGAGGGGEILLSTGVTSGQLTAVPTGWNTPFPSGGNFLASANSCGYSNTATSNGTSFAFTETFTANSTYEFLAAGIYDSTGGGGTASIAWVT